jgi:hypothetical protein
MFSTVERIKS